MPRNRLAASAAILCAAAALLPAAPAPAHHSFAMFDSGRPVTLTGTVKEFRWVNPHSAIFVQVDGSTDPDKLWAVELTSPSNLRRQGWTRTSLQPGDRVSVEIAPLRDGKHGGGFRSLTKLDTGEKL
ncbi:hypothetical protein GRI89_00430 [Altererythrobacter salegens]|uniref:DUF5666 domain-containing protein n=1 Tax=Croceibacterium salegens TaxID=1737568 RepID=A0A6I4SQ08_9SPHN|nr:DUF6152 family protein [Croceibacterium salegens]MXO58011.1 hypothetical protein [Croceibacterium salegens]